MAHPACPRSFCASCAACLPERSGGRRVPAPVGLRGPAPRGSLARRERPGMHGKERRGGTCGGHHRRAATQPGAQAAPSLRVDAGPGIFFVGAPWRASGTRSSRLREPALARRATRREPPGGLTPGKEGEAAAPEAYFCTLRKRTPKADEAGGPSPPAHPWGVGDGSHQDEAGPGAQRAAEGLRTERGHAGVDAPGSGPQRRANGAAQTQPWLVAGKAPNFGQA